MTKDLFLAAINETVKVKNSLIDLEKNIDKSIKLISKSLKNKSKILICGNGGSAADAQHLAAEMLVRLKPKNNRSPLPVMSLSMDTSTLTACGNDYDFSKIFSRPLEALGKKGDILIAISTSGNSKNILEVLKISKLLGIKSIGFLGNNGGKAKKYCDIKLIVKSKNTARIQESHIFMGHYILENVEKNFLKKK